MRKRDITKPTIYLDACIIIDLLEGGKDAAAAEHVFKLADARLVNLVTSVITIAEAWHAKVEIEGKAPAADIQERISHVWSPETGIHLVDVHEIIARDALDLLRTGIEQGWSKTNTCDAIHLITAKNEQANILLTRDGPMRKWSPIVGMKICTPLEADWPELPRDPEPDPQMKLL